MANQPSQGMRGGGATPAAAGGAARPQQPKVNNIKIQIPETTFAMLMQGAQRQQPQGPPPQARPQVDPRVLQALMQRYRSQGAGTPTPAVPTPGA